MAISGTVGVIDLEAKKQIAEIAVEESLRFDPPVLGLFRTPTHDVTLHGVTIPEKTKVMVCFASANHDGARTVGFENRGASSMIGG